MKLKYRVSILPFKGKTYGKNFSKREDCDEYILNQEDVKKACIYNKETKEKEFINFNK